MTSSDESTSIYHHMRGTGHVCGVVLSMRCACAHTSRAHIDSTCLLSKDIDAYARAPSATNTLRMLPTLPCVAPVLTATTRTLRPIRS